MNTGEYLKGGIEVGRPNMFTEQQVKEMKYMRAEGYTLKVIAHKMGCSFAEVWMRTREYDKRKIKYWTTEDIKKLIKLREHGTSYEVISKILSRSPIACKSAYLREKNKQ